MSAEIDARLARFIGQVNDNKELARTLAKGSMDFWGLHGFERTIAIGRLEAGLASVDDERVGAYLDFVEKVLARRISKK